MKGPVFNPILPSWEYVPDAEPRVFGDRLYLYGSHDRFGGENYCLNDYVGWSAPLSDLSRWRYEGVIYSTRDDPANAGGGQTGFAPDCVRGPDGRYYLYYCLNRTPLVSVAVSDAPEGPFTFLGHVHDAAGTPYGGPGSVFNFDPGVLVDGDRVWLYTGFSPAGAMRDSLRGGGIGVDGSYCAELEPDMLTLKSGPVLAAPCAAVAAGTGFAGHAFYEASSPRKIGGRYYLIYSSERSHELCYAVSGRPGGPFTYGGVIISIGDLGLADGAVNYLGNTHGGLAEINGQWYILYHRQTNRCQFSRQCCAEPVQILPDGSIPQVEMTSCGMNGGPLPAIGRYEARIACNLSAAGGVYAYPSQLAKDAPPREDHPYFTQTGGDREKDGDQYIANLRNGAWAGFKYFAFTGRERTITAVLRGAASGVLRVTARRGGGPAAEIPVSPAAGWAAFSAPLAVPAGTAPLYFAFAGIGAVDFTAFTIE